MPGATNVSPVRRFGAFEINLQSGELRKNGMRLRLSGQPFQVLAVLVERPGEMVTREELQSKLWPADTFVDFEHGLNNAVARIREVLDDSPDTPRYVETIPRRGYRFIADVSSSVAARGGQTSSPTGSGEDAGLPAVAPPTPSGAEPARSRLSLGKNVKLFLAGGLCLAVLLPVALKISSWRKSRRGDTPAQIQSIAVLPLENLSGDPSQEYFADGMTDALITKLAGIRGLRVISRTSTMLYKGKRKNLSDIARELDVDGVVEGTVARSNDQVRITAQLIYAPRDSHLWSASFTGSMRDVLELEDKVAGDIANQIGDNLGQRERDGLRKPRTTNLEAYDAYLKGVYSLNKQTPDDVSAAIRYFREAIEKDQEFAMAYARLSLSYEALSQTSEMPSAETYKPAKLAAQKAVALDDNLDQAHEVVAGIAAYYEWDWDKAEAEYKRAIQLNPNSATAHIAYSYLLQILGRSRESLEEERASKILDPVSLNALSISATNSYFRRQYDEGIVQARAAVALYPISNFHVLLSNFYTAKGQDQQSAKEILLAEESGGTTEEWMAALKKANEVGGLKGLRRKRIELNKKAARMAPSHAYDIAIDCAAVGDTEEALVWLERAFQARDIKVYLVGVEPIFDGLRSNPRFIHLVRQLGLQRSQS
jgi:TolB-like protein/DNA-binding winged helix-turn-helix (wHTH) protein